MGLFKRQKPKWLGEIHAQGIDIKIAEYVRDCSVKLNGRHCERTIESITIELDPNEGLPKFVMKFIGIPLKPKKAK